MKKRIQPLLLNYSYTLLFVLSFFVFKTSTAQELSAITIEKMSLIPSDQCSGSRKCYFLKLDLNHLQQGKKLYVLFGSEIYAGDVLTSTGNITHSGNTSSLNFNGKTYSLCEHDVMVQIEVLNSYFPTMKCITAYIEDNDGKLTNKVNYIFPN